MAGVNDYLDTVLPETPASAARKQALAASVQATKAPDESATAAIDAPAALAPNVPQPHEFSGIHEVIDHHTNTLLAEDTDGSIFLRGVGGKLEKFAPAEAGKLLADKFSGYFPATVDEAHEHQQVSAYDSASLAAKADYIARRTLVNVADGVTAPVRLGAKLLGASPQVDKDLSGENVIRKLDTMLAGADTAKAEAEGQRSMEGGNALVDTATDIGGLVLGGELGAGATGLAGRAVKVGAEVAGFGAKSAGALASTAKALSLEGLGEAAGSTGAKLAQSFGLDATKAAKLGSYADSVAQGAAIGQTQAAHDAWVKNEALTSEAQWNALGLGALLGGGGHVALDALLGAPRAGLSAAERVFGKSRVAAESTLATDASAQELAESLTGIKQPEGFGNKIKGMTDWMKDKIQQVQAEKTGIALKDVKEYGVFGEKHAWAEQLSRDRDKIFSDGTKDLTEALKQMHAAGADMNEEVFNVAMKKEHMAHLLADSDAIPIMRLAKDKAAELQDAYADISAVDGNGRTLLGGGKHIEEIKAAYENAYDSLVRAKAPEDVTSALDVFKRSADRAKTNAEKSAERVTSGIERNQAFARADLMRQVADKTRTLLEDDSLFGKFGEAQKQVNSRISNMLDTEKYLRGQLLENTGEQRGANYGATRWEFSPGKVESYLNGLGTNRSATTDQFLRNNIAARKELAQTLGHYYDLGEHAANIRDIGRAADKAQATLANLDETLRVTNVRDDMLAKEAAAKGHGESGITLAAMAGHMLAGPLGAGTAVLHKAISTVLENPVSMTKQALVFRDAAQKLEKLVTSNVGKALEARVGGRTTAAVRVLASRESQERYERRYVTTVTRVAELAANPEAAVDAVSTHAAHIEHPGVQQALTSTSMAALAFLATKLPKPLYQNAVVHGNQLNNVSSSQRDSFMRYAAAVNRPADFFKALPDGNASQEQAETAQALMPQAFGIAQQEAIMRFASGKVKASYQVRLNVQRMLQVQIEPIVNPALQSFIKDSVRQSTAAKANAQQQQGGSGGKPIKSASTALQSPLSNLKV